MQVITGLHFSVTRSSYVFENKRIQSNLEAEESMVRMQVASLHISGYCPFGEFLCFATVYGQCVCIIVSSCTLVVIGFERWVAFSLTTIGNNLRNLLAVAWSWDGL